MHPKKPYFHIGSITMLDGHILAFSPLTRAQHATKKYIALSE